MLPETRLTLWLEVVTESFNRHHTPAAVIFPGIS
jgi:hypothetical protein